MTCPFLKICTAYVTYEHYCKYCKTDEYQKCEFYRTRARETAPPRIWAEIEEEREHEAKKI